MKIEGSADTKSNGELRTFSFRLSTSSRRSLFETTVLGTVEGNELVLTVSSPRSERTERRPLDEPIVFPLNLYYSLAARGWTTGASYRVRLFDPMTLSEGEAIIDIKELEVVRWGGREEEAYRLQTTFAGLTTTAWVNESGEVLQEETPLGWDASQRSAGEQPSSPKRGCGSCSRCDAAIGDTGYRLRRRRVQAYVGDAEARQLSRWA